jgi:SAM-dependent methyltransferase
MLLAATRKKTSHERRNSNLTPTLITRQADFPARFQGTRAATSLDFGGGVKHIIRAARPNFRQDGERLRPQMASTKRTLNASKYDTDKAQHTHYLRNYEEYFRPLLDRDIRLLELGVLHGGSLQLWRDYFERGRIVGLDLNPVEIEDPTGRIRFYQGGQQDTVLLDRIARECAPEGFDIIIDDCSHVGDLARVSFWHLFDNHLKPGGLYVIEDWGTGYWDAWPDGVRYRRRGLHDRHSKHSYIRHRLNRAATRLHESAAGRLPLVGRLASAAKRTLQRGLFHSHDFGMVGFIKELVDELGMADITHPQFGHAPHRTSKFREMRLSTSHLFVVKA